MYRNLLAAIFAGTLMAAMPLGLAQAQTPTKEDSKTTKKSASEKKPLSKGLAAARERQKQCGVEWKADKAAGKIAKGQTWPKYWSACNKRLKAKSG